MLVSAAIADGPPRRVLEVVSDGVVELVLPEPVLAELRRVLREKLGVGDGPIEAAVALLEELAVDVAQVPDQVESVSGDPDDDRILAAAVAGGAEVLVSGDHRHLLPLGQFRSMRIMRPQDLLAVIAG